MRLLLFLFLFFSALSGMAQETTNNRREVKTVIRDTVFLDSSGIQPTNFRVLNKKGESLNPLSYRINFSKGHVYFPEETQHLTDSVIIQYVRYPDFMTRSYYVFDENLIVENSGNIDKLYTLGQRNVKNNFTPFDGLNTSGSITRGITMGNNQNAVMNSQLDLQITGKLSETVSIRASIQDANLPTQEGGYSQSLNEFDMIFMEVFGDDWNIRAGDIDLTNTSSYFGRFTKKVQGILAGGTIRRKDGSTLSAYGAGALVKGIFTKSEFKGQEGNQGPYKLIGPNGELYILVVSGSERVYVNGLLLKRGENEDYVIDYNSGEIRFNATYPITSDMRIVVEYQFTDRNYTRFIGYGGIEYENKFLNLGVYAYSENDAKNQPLQQNLSEEQVAILKAAGDDKSAMYAPSAVPDTFGENKTLYKKEIRDGIEIFVFSNNPDDQLYNVRFTMVGENNGNYILSDHHAITRIYEYVAPVNGVPQGKYEPIIRLNAPEKLQLAGIKGNYHPSEKTHVDFEFAMSNKDENLFSQLDNDDNVGFAGKFGGRQRLVTTSDSLKLDVFGNLDIVQKEFSTIERLYNVEFDRDWNLYFPEGNQLFTTAGMELLLRDEGRVRYEFQNLNFSENFNGNRHVLSGFIRKNRLRSLLQSSIMNSTSDSIRSQFLRLNNTTTYSMEKHWVGGKVALENNSISNILKDSLSNQSQRFSDFEVFTGRGDSTKVYVQIGYNYRVTDSVRFNRLHKVNSANTYYLKSRLISSENAQLSAYVNYREIKYHNSAPDSPQFSEASEAKRPDRSLSSRLLYSQSLFEKGIQLNTALETSNGVVPQQEFTYVKTDPGQGIYMWIDYNNNGIQELDEFEVAQFPDQAEYIRILLPNRIFVKVRQNKFSQTITLNPQLWSDREGFQKLLSHFHNQTSYLIDRKVRRKDDGFELNPFKDGGADQLGLMLNFRNVLFFNRGKQHYTTSYTFLSSSNDNLLSTGLQRNILTSHQLNFNHKFWEVWLLNLKGTTDVNSSSSEGFQNRNYELRGNEVNPKISYLLNLQTRFDVFYHLKNKTNHLGDRESLAQQTWGVSFAYSNAEKISINGEFNYIDNSFKGSAYSPVAYQMLEGLQPGTNFTWRSLFQKRITDYLDASLMYYGRKSEHSKAVHTGSVQLRAFL